MLYVHPMVEKKYPTDEAVAAFLKAVDDPATGKFFVHCAGGRHRTGALGAVYRFTKYGWDYDQVYREMKQFDFYTRWGHGGFKKFVEDYWQRVHRARRRRPPPSRTSRSEVPTNCRGLERASPVERPSSSRSGTLAQTQTPLTPPVLTGRRTPVLFSPLDAFELLARVRRMISSLNSSVLRFRLIWT